MALEEMINVVEPDSTFRTGKAWAGVWTRDISYSIILSMAALQPLVAKYSLMRKVKNGRIIQDTGTGGAYPVSSDRIVWAVAAWEFYKVTGSEDWLKEAGMYANDFRYANGNGPINTSNKCAIRTLKSDNTFAGTVVLPQRGTDEWSDWGYTNTVQVKLEKGTHSISLSFEPANENMNGEVNQAMLDNMRITKL